MSNPQNGLSLYILHLFRGLRIHIVQLILEGGLRRRAEASPANDGHAIQEEVIDNNHAEEVYHHAKDSYSSQERCLSPFLPMNLRLRSRRCGAILPK